MAAIETEALVRRFKDVEAVAGVELRVPRGEIYAFLGPNGAGKTTTVRMLTTLLTPTSGSARVAGFDVVSQAGDVRRSIGVALQAAALDPLMTGVELLRLQATLHGIPRIEGRRRAATLIERVGLTRAGDRRIGTYSGGMARRLDLATALVHEPSVLFLDEPTTGLDPTSRIAVWDEVRRLNGEGTTVFLTTQYLEEADGLADRVGIIADGRIVAEDTPRALKAEIGRPRLELQLAEGHAEQAGGVLERFGEVLASEGDAAAVALEGGAGQVAAVVRALDDAGLAVGSLDLVEPTLDDVFLAKTGRQLEGADAAPSTNGGDPATAAPAASASRR